MSIVLITALVSIFGTLVIGYFVWLTISVCKLKKQVKNNSTDLETITKRVDNNFIEFYERIQTGEKDIHDRLDNEHRRVVNEFDELARIRNNSHVELYRDLDRRFDRVYKKINPQLTEFPDLMGITNQKQEETSK